MALMRVAFGGALYNDIWECRLHIEGSSVFSTSYEAGLKDVQADVTKWFQANSFTPGSNLKWVKLNEIDPATGHYTSQSDSHTLEFTPVNGSATQAIAPQLTTCVTLTTAAQRGVAAYGRFYPPPCSQVINSDGHILTGDLSKIANAAKTLLNDLANWPGIDWPGSKVVILGKGGVTRPVTGVRVGSVVDTQRRRRNALRERYTSVSL